MWDALKSPTARSVLWSLFVVVIIVVFSVCRWDWLSVNESPSATIRNLILIAVAIVGLPLAIWRSIVAERQVETSRLALANERYQKGAELLGSQELHVRLGGIYALHHLSSEHPTQYHLSTLKIFTSFLWQRLYINVTKPEKHEAAAAEVLRAIGTASAAQVHVETVSGFRLDLSFLNLSGIDWSQFDTHDNCLNFSAVNFVGTNLTEVRLPGAFLFQAMLADANLTDAYMPGVMLDSCRASSATLVRAKLESSNLNYAQLDGADLTNANLTNAALKRAYLLRAKLCGAGMTGTDLEKTDLSAADLTGCWGLTQAQLDGAVALNGHPPVLTNAVDCETRQQLVWKGSDPSPDSRRRRLPVVHRILPSNVNKYPLGLD